MRTKSLHECGPTTAVRLPVNQPGSVSCFQTSLACTATPRRMPTSGHAAVMDAERVAPRLSSNTAFLCPESCPAHTCNGPNAPWDRPGLIRARARRVLLAMGDRFGSCCKIVSLHLEIVAVLAHFLSLDTQPICVGHKQAI